MCFIFYTACLFMAFQDDEEAEDDLDELELRRLALCAFMSHNSKPTEDDWLVEGIEQKHFFSNTVKEVVIL